MEGTVKPRKPENELERLEALRDYGILDTAPEAALDDLTALAAHICGTRAATVSLVDAERQWFKSKVGLRQTETPRDISFCGHGILEDDLFIVVDAAKDERFFDNPMVTGEPHIRFYAGAQLRNPDGLALGMLCVVDDAPRRLEPWQEESLRVLARQVIAQFDLRRQNRQLTEAVAQLQTAQESLKRANRLLEEQATTDGLTGLKNHRVFQEALRLEFSRSLRYHTDLSLIMVDVDRFKDYNDTYGHPEGDNVLHAVGSILADRVRDVDLAARYGGEEFAIILPNTSKAGASELAEDLRHAVEQAPWSQRPITISVGAATRTGDTVSAPALLAEADTALYHSKVSGRNMSTHLADLAPEATPAPEPDPMWMRKKARLDD
jgi:diguanylate cyclase (GGDEF)-like protein